MFNLTTVYNGDVDAKRLFVHNALKSCMNGGTDAFFHTVMEKIFHANPTRYKMYRRKVVGHGFDISGTWPGPLKNIYVMETQECSTKDPGILLVAVTRKGIATTSEQDQYDSFVQRSLSKMCSLYGHSFPENWEKNWNGLRISDNYVGLAAGNLRTSFPRIIRVAFNGIGWFDTNNKAHIFSDDIAVVRSVCARAREFQDGKQWSEEYKSKLAMSLLNRGR